MKSPKPQFWERESKNCLNIFCNYTMTLHKSGNKTANINIKNCSLSVVLRSTDQKLQKSLKKWHYSASRWHWGDVMMVGNITFLVIFLPFLIHRHGQTAAFNVYNEYRSMHVSLSSWHTLLERSRVHNRTPMFSTGHACGLAAEFLSRTGVMNTKLHFP